MVRCLLLLLLCSPVVWGESVSGADQEGAAEVGQRVYRVVGQDGSVTFTDNPEHPGAKPVEVRERNTIPMVPSRRPAPANPEPAVMVDYQISITSPEDQATLRNPDSLSVGFAVSPALVSGHRVQLLHNGNTLPAALIQWPDRGAHTFVAQVLDADDKVLAESAPVVVFVHRTSVNQPR